VIINVAVRSRNPRIRRQWPPASRLAYRIDLQAMRCTVLDSLRCRSLLSVLGRASAANRSCSPGARDLSS
jgi:hypothetical protein